jgi:hypothetical protein
VALPRRLRKESQYAPVGRSGRLPFGARALSRARPDLPCPSSPAWSCVGISSQAAQKVLTSRQATQTAAVAGGRLATQTRAGSGGIPTSNTLASAHARSPGPLPSSPDGAEAEAMTVATRPATSDGSGTTSCVPNRLPPGTRHRRRRVPGTPAGRAVAWWERARFGS